MYTDRGDEIGFMYSRFAITRVIVLESSYLFLTEGMYTSGYITVNVIKCLKKLTKLCILIQIKSDLLELFYLAFYIARYRYSVFYIQRCSIFSKIGFAVKITLTDVNSDVCKIHSDFRSGIICFIFFYRGLS